VKEQIAADGMSEPVIRTGGKFQYQIVLRTTLELNSKMGLTAAECRKPSPTMKKYGWQSRYLEDYKTELIVNKQADVFDDLMALTLEQYLVEHEGIQKNGNVYEGPQKGAAGKKKQEREEKKGPPKVFVKEEPRDAAFAPPSEWQEGVWQRPEGSGNRVPWYATTWNYANEGWQVKGEKKGKCKSKAKDDKGKGKVGGKGDKKADKGDNKADKGGKGDKKADKELTKAKEAAKIKANGRVLQQIPFCRRSVLPYP
jgi:hypothetical protein